MLAKRLALALLSALLITSSYAQVGPGGLTPRSVQKVTDSVTTCYPYSLAFTSGSITSCTNGVANISAGGSVGIGTFYWNNTGINIYNNNAGNVGIGTVNPGAQLDVNGTIRDTGEYVNGNLGIGTANPGDSLDSTGAIRANGAGSSFFGNVGIGTNNINANPAVNGSLTVYSGNVGIDSSVPGDVLDVLGSARIIGRLDVNGTLNNSMFIVDKNGNVGIGTTQTTNAGMVVMNGNVGIGTWIPSALFDVGTGAIGNHFIFISGTGIRVTNITGGTSNNSTLTLASTNQASGTTDAINLNLKSNPFVILQDNTGIYNMGIGTQVPRQQLDVAGTLNLASPFIVTAHSNVGVGTQAAAFPLTVQGNIGISTIAGQAMTIGFSGIGATSCVCKQYASGICLSATCT